jgi:S-DNA-T family DNA segregation ATPase FtsK/SpoIIIE
VDRKKHEIWAVCLFIPTLLILFSLVSFSSADLNFFNSSAARGLPRNWIGFLGSNLAWLLLFLFGLGAYGLVLIGLWMAFLLLRGNLHERWRAYQLPGIALLFLAAVSLTALWQPKIKILGQELLSGGQIGQTLGQFLAARLRPLGATIVLGGVLLIALLLATPLSLQSAWQFAGRICTAMLTGLDRLIQRLWSLLRPTSPPEVPADRSEVASEAPLGSSTVVETFPPEIITPTPSRANKSRKRDIALPPPPEKHEGKWTLPPIALLDTHEGGNLKPDPTRLEHKARVLEEKLADFGVNGKVSGISPGPVVTMFEYAPAPGIKISRIVGLSDDLAMALKATSVRVVAPIPGKAAIGIELPNEHRELVVIRDVLEADAFAASTAPLTIALGKNIMGEPTVANLGKMPHLLIAGATGTGKSVCINTVLSSLLFHNTPEELRLLLIDPKRIELSSYEGIPHLIHPVVTDAKMATRALRWAVQEMELRYRLLADKNTRNIESYNRVLGREKPKEPASEAGEWDPTALPHHLLPYVVVIIDELADLMMVASREVEESIIRLAQMARAAGIHLILATQRPSVDVLTGIIKANVPTRISFQVSSKIDSRTILDTMGAESLLGSGDMLFMPPGTAKLQRIHGAYVSEPEVQRLTEYWRNQELSEDPLRERVNFQEQSAAESVSEDELDEKYEQAIQLVLETRQASISMLQRRLRVGYNRAARMIEIMEQQGIVGPSDGIKPREVMTGKNP